MKKIPIGTHIYEFQCDSILLNKIYEEVSTSDKIIWLPNKPLANLYQADTDALQLPPAQLGYLDKKRQISYYHPDLYNWFDDCISEVAKDSIPGTKLTINEAWLNKLKFGQNSKTPHYHSKSVYSGLLYLTTHHGTSFTNFFPQNDAAKIMNNYLNFGNSSHLIDANKAKDIFLSEPLAGKLLIFPSTLMHNISTHTDIKNIRYTLAFNTFCDGLLGDIGDNTTANLSIKVKSVKDSYEEFIASETKIKL